MFEEDTGTERGSKTVAYWDQSIIDAGNQSVYTSTDKKGNIAYKYSGSTLDKYLNEGWFNKLNEKAKAAIKDSTIEQFNYATDIDALGNGEFKYVYDSRSEVYQDSTTTTITRKMYALGVKDLLDYFEMNPTGSFNFEAKQIWNFFWNQNDNNRVGNALRLRSTTYAWEVGSVCDDITQVSPIRIDSWNGQMTDYGVDDGESSFARPVFKIDLSNIEFSMYEG